MFSNDLKRMMNGLKSHCRAGYSLFSFLGDAGLSFEEWTTLVEENPEIKRDIEMAQSYEVRYWEECLKTAMERGDTKGASIASKVLAQRAHLFEKVYKKNINSTAPNEMIKRRLDIANPIRNRDILDDEV